MLHVFAVNGGGAEEQDPPDRTRGCRATDVQDDGQVLLEDFRGVAKLLLDRRADDEGGVRIEERFQRRARLRARQVETRRRTADDRNVRRRGRECRRQAAADITGLAEQHDAAECRNRHQLHLPTHSANR